MLSWIILACFLNFFILLRVKKLREDDDEQDVYHSKKRPRPARARAPAVDQGEDSQQEDSVDVKRYQPGDAIKITDSNSNTILYGVVNEGEPNMDWASDAERVPTPPVPEEWRDSRFWMIVRFMH